MKSELKVSDGGENATNDYCAVFCCFFKQQKLKYAFHIFPKCLKGNNMSTQPLNSSSCNIRWMDCE